MKLQNDRATSSAVRSLPGARTERLSPPSRPTAPRGAHVLFSAPRRTIYCDFSERSGPALVGKPMPTLCYHAEMEQITREKLKRLRHPKEESRYLLTVIVVVPFLILAVIATLATMLIPALVVLAIVFGTWFAGKLARARFLGDLPRVTDDNFPEIHRIICECRYQFDYKGEVDCFIVNEGSFNAAISHLFRRKTILLNAGLIESASDTEIRWIIARFVASLSLRHYRLAWLSVFVTSLEKIAFLNLLLYPYERAVILSGDQIALYAIGGDLNAVLTATKKLMVGGKSGADVQLAGIVRQHAELRQSFFGWLVKGFSTFPHNVERFTNILRFAQREYARELVNLLNNESEETRRYVLGLLAASEGVTGPTEGSRAHMGHTRV